MTNLDKATAYARDAISGKIPACLYVKQAAQRFLNDIEEGNPLYYYNPAEVDRVVKFIGALDLTEQKRPKKFILEPWQTFIVANIYGVIEKATEERKYKQAYVELARKNGKSQLATGLSMYH